MKFDDYPLSPDLKKNIAALGFKKPTDIQYKSIPGILREEDILAVAQTGTGKTAAFAIPIIQLLDTARRRGYIEDSVRCIVMVPTHELALQLEKVFNQLAKKTSVDVLGIYGGVDQAPQVEALKTGVDILIATPGRLFDLESQGHLNISNASILVLDEADHMLDLGFIHDIRQLSKRLPRKRQTLFFSATINQKIKKLAYSLINEQAIRIQVSPKDRISKNIQHAYLKVEMDDKRFFLERFIKEEPEAKMLVFVRTKVRAERVMKAMERVGLESQTMHSGKDQKDRNRVMERFSTGETKVLIATDVSARGIDIPNVEVVINYDLPDVAENYVHRVGRTGRGRNKGKAYSFCSEQEYEQLGLIEDFLGRKVTEIELAKQEYADTKLFANETEDDWKSLLDVMDKEEKVYKEIKKKNHKNRLKKKKKR